MENNWKETTNRYIVFIDIMGFSNLVYRNTHSSVKTKMLKFSKFFSDLEKVTEEVSLKKANSLSRIKTTVFSDSVLLISEDGSAKSLKSIVVACELILAKSFDSGIAIKGAVSYGMITADFLNSLFFGKGLIDAYKLEEELLFFGIALDHKVEKKLRTLKVPLEDNLFVDKKVPTKSGKIKHKVINWLNISKDAIGSDNHIEVLEKLYENMSGRPRLYLDNSIEVYS